MSHDFVTITVTVTSDVTDVWQYDPHYFNPNPKFKIEK